MASLQRGRWGWSRDRLRVQWKGEERWQYTYFDDEPAALAFLAERKKSEAERGIRRRPGARPVPLDVRIRRNVKIEPAGCWIWQGRPSNRGYGQLNIRIAGVPKCRSAHRVSYETFVGPIPEGQVIDHLCRVRMCVNPEHLEAVTQRENVLRSPIAPAALNAAKTHCPQGHKYTTENTYTPPGTTNRCCRACLKARYEATKAVA